MAAAVPLKRPVKVGLLVRKRLRELKRTPRELAEAVQVSESYIADLVAGRRRPPAPGRTDVYAPMAKFLRLHRNDLPSCARHEREGDDVGRRRLATRLWTLVLELCDPSKARTIVRRGTKRARGSDLEYVVAQRLLEVAQSFVRRQLDDEVGIRLAATREGRSYLEMRMKLLEFLDATADSLSLADFEEFLRPRIAAWDMDLETRAMRIVLRAAEPGLRQQRALGL